MKPGGINSIEKCNHFSLLGSIADLFGLQRLGYADAPGLPELDKPVFNTPH